MAALADGSTKRVGNGLRSRDAGHRLRQVSLRFQNLHHLIEDRPRRRGVRQPLRVPGQAKAAVGRDPVGAVIDGEPADQDRSGIVSGGTNLVM